MKLDKVDDQSSALTLPVCPVYFEETLLAVWRHGWQRRRLGSSEVLEETTDTRKIYRLVQLDKYDMPLLTSDIWWSFCVLAYADMLLPTNQLNAIQAIFEAHYSI